MTLRQPVSPLLLLGAVALAGEAVVHVQQYFALFHDIRWIGPLFLANAAACAVTVAGLAHSRTRYLAALAGVVTSAVALAGLIVSYGQGLFGWQEGGFRPIIQLTVSFELAAVVLLSAALAAASTAARTSADGRALSRGPSPLRPPMAQGPAGASSGTR